MDEMDQMGEGTSGPGPALSSGAGNGAATRTRPRPAGPTNPSPGPPMDAPPFRQPPTRIPPPSQPPSDVVRYGPGVPVSEAASETGPEAERVWRTGRPPNPPRRTPRLRRLLGSALTVILLAASGVVLYLRLHHAPFGVTGVVISQQTKTGCGVDVTGRITTDGAAGTVSYQWIFRPGRQAPQPLSQSVAAGQQDVDVTAAINAQGHGSASRMVTLQVLGPEKGTATTAVVLSC
jgi:hypothetical protein